MVLVRVHNPPASTILLYVRPIDLLNVRPCTLSPSSGVDPSISAVSSTSTHRQSIPDIAQDTSTRIQPFIMQSIFASTQSTSDSRRRRSSDHVVPECSLPVDEEPSLPGLDNGLDNVFRGPRLLRSTGEHARRASQRPDQQQAGRHGHRSSPYIGIFGGGSQHGDYFHRHRASPQPLSLIHISEPTRPY